MSTSLLYNAFGARGQSYEKTEYVNGEVHYYVQLKERHIRCPICKSRQLTRHGGEYRPLWTLPIGWRPVRLFVWVPRVQCRYCKVRRRVEVPFADRRVSYTKALARHVVEKCRVMTKKDVANTLPLGWDVVKSIHKKYLKARFGKPRLRDLKRIAIDEISIGRNHRYLTVVLDLTTGAVVYIGEGKGADALKAFWTSLGRAHAKLEAVATDMSEAYISAVLNNAAETTLVFDRFHIVRLFNKKITKLRRDLQREAEETGKDVLKGIRWLLLKHPEDLDHEHDEHKRLHDALVLNQPLALAYYMTDEFRRFWEMPDKDAAARFLDRWIERAKATDVAVLRQLGRSMENHRYGLLAWYDFPISTGPLEGTNNKIKTLQRQAYGYRDQEYLRLLIFACHETRYALVG